MTSTAFIVARSALLGVGALAALHWRWLSLPVLFLLFISWLALPALTRWHWTRLCHIAGGLVATVAFVRFVVTDGVAGVVQGGQAATSRQAVSRLREILFAQDAVRRGGLNDIDGDGIGSATRLPHLAGAIPPKGAVRLTVLAPKYRNTQATPIGPASLIGAYLYIVCLPTQDGAFSALPTATVDADSAERRFLAYAWPADARLGIVEAFFIDEHERILVSKNRSKANGEPRYAGPNHPPPCTAALDPASDFRPWRGKKPRTKLPGI